MDLSDVAYDAFLMNGQRRLQLPGKPGEKVRVRLINAGAASYFYLDAAAGPLRIISADGQDVVPFEHLSAEITAVLACYKAERHAGETLGDFCHRKGIEGVRAWTDAWLAGSRGAG
ncbi:MAG: hypothetical protein ACK53Y_23975 [bacterium]